MELTRPWFVAMVTRHPGCASVAAFDRYLVETMAVVCKMSEEMPKVPALVAYQQGDIGTSGTSIETA
jgi:hypothetical protein